MQTFTQFQGQLALTFGKRCKKDTKMHVTTAAISGESSPGAQKDPMSCNSRKHQNTIDIQAVEITSMQANLKKAQEENKKPRWVFDPSSIAQVICKAVNSLQTKPDRSSSGMVWSPSHAGKPYHGKQRPPQLHPGADSTLNPDMTCFYYKDTGHRLDNCIQMNCKLGHKLQMTKGIVIQPDSGANDT